MNQDQSFVFVDTSAWFALAYEGDPYHAAAQSFIASSPRLLTTNFIIDETITLTLARLGYLPARALGEKLWSEELARIIYVSQSDQRTAWELFKAYDDKTFSFTDCTSFAVMERLGLEYAFAFDADFEQSGRFTQLPSS